MIDPYAFLYVGIGFSVSIATYVGLYLLLMRPDAQ